MDIWHAIILGLVEGITEYLPISSTGHLILTSALLGLDEPPEVKASVDAFNIVIQGGAILAVLGLYRARVWQMIWGLLGKDAQGLRLAINLIVAFLPAAVLGVLLDDWIDANLFFAAPVLAALALGGVWMILLDRWRTRHLTRETEARVSESSSRFRLEIENITLLQALLIGLAQCVAMWPGTSRAMMTIAGGTMLGLKPKAAAEFSFLLGLPTLGGACVYKLAKNIMESRETQVPNLFDQLGWTAVIIGIVVAAISAALAVKWLVAFLTKHGLAPFGWYRLALCALLSSLMMAKIVQIG